MRLELRGDVKARDRNWGVSGVQMEFKAMELSQKRREAVGGLSWVRLISQEKDKKSTMETEKELPGSRDGRASEARKETLEGGDD